MSNAVLAPLKSFVARLMSARRFEAHLKAVHEADMLKVRKGRKTSRTFAGIVNSVNLTAAIEAEVAADPLTAYVALGLLRRPVTEDEAAIVAESSEIEHQGILPCGEPAQKELFIETAVRVITDDVDGSQFASEVRRAVRMAQAVSQMENLTLYVRYSANVVVRALRNQKEPLRARYGGRLYISDRPTHSGILVGIVTKNEKGGTLGDVEWVVPGFAK